MHHDASVFAARRDRVLSAIGDRAVAVFASGPERRRSHDTDYRYRASSDVLYLTGFEEPEALVVLAPGHEDGPLVMFVRPRDKERETWTGRRHGCEGAVERYGADTAYALEELDEQLPRLLDGAETVYCWLGGPDGLQSEVLEAMHGLRYRRGKPPGAPAALRDTRDLLHPMRAVKSPEEIALIERACAISAEAHIAAMRACRPGMREYELQALIEYTFLKNGALSPSYATIVASGDNATILHYTDNRAEIGEGDLVLIDAGAEFNYYAGDITRTFPASGRFSGAARDVYQLVLAAEVAAIEMCTVGNTWRAIHEATVRTLTEGMVDLGLLEGEVDGLIEEETYKRFFMHKTGHWLGIDVHDVGPYWSGQEPAAIEAGVIQTIEPGLYIEDGAEGVPEAFWGIGVRIEDDVLTTEAGPVNLTASCPKSIEALEEIVGSGFSIEV